REFCRGGIQQVLGSSGELYGLVICVLLFFNLGRQLNHQHKWSLMRQHIFLAILIRNNKSVFHKKTISIKWVI
uniref:Uncharacterized protein n=1 Tax=Pseudonaja textilis TaxID=8673 RepID=A0A670YE16_PSETE